MSALLDILQHAVGVDAFGQGRRYRNHFVTGEGSVDWPICLDAVTRGLMVRRESALTGGDSLFLVTAAGQHFVTDNSPAPPKRTRAQMRYARWLAADWFAGSFGEWLKSPYGREAA